MSKNTGVQGAVSAKRCRLVRVTSRTVAPSLRKKETAKPERSLLLDSRGTLPHVKPISRLIMQCLHFQYRNTPNR